MGIKELKEMCCQANLELARKGLVVYTWGNVSQLDREKGIFVIKPSGVPYEELTGEMMVAVDVETGRALEDRYKPSSDTPTHVELYRAFEGIGGVTHTHSPAATAWAQACRGIPCLGTTHADYFHGDVPVTRHLTKEEVAKMAMWTYAVNAGAESLPQHVADKHFLRKHGPNAYYGQ